MARETITDLIDRAMRLGRTNAVKIEREYGVPAGWTRQLKAGRIGGGANPDWVALLAKALSLDEAELWSHLGRMDKVAALRSGITGTDPSGHAVGTPDLLDAIEERLERVLARTTGVRERMAPYLDEATEARRRAYWIKAGRVSRWPDIREAAKALNVPLRDLQAWERGTRRPSSSQLIALADALDLSVTLFDQLPETVADVLAQFRLGKLNEQRQALRQQPARRRRSA